MPPAKKTTPAKSTLADRLGTKEETVIEETPETPVITEPDNNVDVEGNPRVETNTMPDAMAGKTDPSVDEQGQVNVVPVWKENPEHNLGKVHPDVLPQPNTQHQTQTSKQVYVTEYAGVAENDDKGFPERDVADEHPEGEYVSEYAGESDNDDKNIKNER